MFFIKILSRLPLSILYLVSDIISFLLKYIFQYRRKVIQQNIKIAFPNFTSIQINQTIHAFYKNLGDIIVETIKGYSISSEELIKRVTISNKELVDNFFKVGQPIIVMTSHLGNWEWLLLANCVLLDYEVDAVYKQINNRFFNRLMFKIRSRFNARLIEKNVLLRDVVKRKEIPRILAMVSDQSPSSSAANIWYPFFNKEAPFYSGAEKIAQMTGYPVVFVKMKRIKRGYYEVAFVLIAKPPYSKSPDITKRYIQLIEETIIQNPSEWLWSHKRWKHNKHDSV